MRTGTQFDTTKMIYEAIYISCFSTAFARKSINNTVARESARAASELKPVSQQMYIKKLIKLKVKDWGKRGKNVANKFKRTPSKQWMYSNPVEWKKFTRHVEIARKLKMQQQQEDSLIKQLTSPRFPSANKNPDLSPDTEIVKITTVIEAVRQKRRRSANAPASTREETNGAERAIGKKRSKRSLREPDYARRAREEIRSIMNERSRYPKRRYRDPRREASPAKKRASGDLKAASAMPSAVFYKRIWEYINGTRPHSDITRDYDSREDNPEREKSACTDRDRVAASQSRVNESRATSPGGVKPERAFYERIWDIINATRGDPKARSKRNATAECAQEREADSDENRRATNEGAALLDITDAVDPPEAPDPGAYVSNFWIVANKTQWQPERPAPVNIVHLGSISSPSANVASASEVDDLNKFPDKIQSSADHLASGDSADETRNQSQAITEPGPPYSSKEEDFTVPSSTARALQTAHSIGYSADTTPIYDPANIPYVEVPDYSDKRENILAKNNQSSGAEKYKEYDNDYVDPGQLRSVERFSSSSSPDAEVEHNIQATNDELATPLNVSRSNCEENKDSECVTQYSVENVNLNNNTEDVVPRSPEDSAERENSTEEFVHFDINEYRKPFEFEFIGKDPVFKSSRAASSEETREEDTKHVKEANSGSGESKEYEEYATYPKEKYNSGDNSTYKREPEEYEKYFTYPKEKEIKRNHEENSNDAEKSEEETYPREKYTKYENEKIPKEESKGPEEYAKYFTYPKEKDVKRNNEDNSNAEKSEEETYPREKYTKYENEKIPKEESKGSEEYEKYFAYPKGKDTEHDDEKHSNEKSEEYETYAAYPEENAKRDNEENPSPSEESEEYETHATYEKEKNASDAEEDPAGNEKSEEHEAYGTYATGNDKKSLEHSGDETNATYPKEELYDYSAKSNDHHDNYYPISEEKDETQEETSAEEGEKSRGISDKDQYDEKDFFKHILGEDRNKESSDRIDTEREFLSRYFTEDVLRKMQDNSTAEEDKEKEESKNREEIHRTLSEILDKKDRYSRLDDNLDKMIEKGEAIPIRYNNFWSLEYHSPKNIEKKESEEEKEEA